MSDGHSHDGDFLLLLALIVLIAVAFVLVTMSFNDRLEVLEALHTPTPVATEEVPTA